MDEWQVGDPVGLGNDAGVPDIPYMGYLNNGEDDEDEPPYNRGGNVRPRDEALAKEAFDLQYDGRYREAMELIGEAIEINPNNPNHWNIKAIILDNSGKHMEALRCYDKSLRMRSSRTVIQNKALCLYRIAQNMYWKNDYDQALDYVNQALAHSPKDEDRKSSLYLKANILDSMGMEVQAKKCRFLATGNIKEIEELERKEKMIKSSTATLINITGTQFYKGPKPLHEGVAVDLIRDPENSHDRNAIRVEINGETVGYVGNGPRTVPDGTKSATEIRNEIGDTARAEVMFPYMGQYIIAKLI